MKNWTHWLAASCAGIALAVTAVLPANAAVSVYPNGADGGDNIMNNGLPGFYPEERQLDYDFILSMFEELLPTIIPTWNTVALTITHQVSPLLYGFDNNNNGIPDSDHLDLLAAVVNGGAAAAGGVLGTDVTRITNNFNNNRAVVQQRELVFPRISVTNVPLLGTITRDNARTGGSVPVPLSDPLFLPSLWTKVETTRTDDKPSNNPATSTRRGLLAEGGEMLEIVLRDVLAGEMTLAPAAVSNEITHIQSFVRTVVTEFIRQNLGPILAGIGDVTADNSNYTTLDVDVNIQTDLGNLRVRIAGATHGSQHTQQMITHFVNSFSPTPPTTTWTGAGHTGSGAPPAPGAYPGTFIVETGAGTVAAPGNLNRSGNTNLQSWNAATVGTTRRQLFMNAEGITAPPLQFVPIRPNPGISGFSGSPLTIGTASHWVIVGGDTTAKAYDWESVVQYEYKHTNPALGGTTSGATYTYNPLTGAVTGVQHSMQVADDTWTRVIPHFTIAQSDPAPFLVDIDVLSAQEIRVSFSEQITGGTVFSNYTISGTGRGSFNNNPNIAQDIGGNNFLLTWNSPQEMRDGGNITITAGGTIQDLSANSMGTPNSLTCSGCGIGTPPTVNSIVANTPGPTNAASVTFTVTFSESVTGPAPANFSLFTTGTASGNIASVLGTGATRTVTVDTLAGTGTIRLDLSTPGGIADLATNPLANSLNGGVSTIDRDPPAVPSVPDLLASSDSGFSDTDNITNDNTPTLTGTSDPNVTIQLRSGVTPVGTTTSTAGGVWTITTSPLSDGVHNLSATAADSLGNTSAAGPPLAVTIDTIAPAVPPVPDLEAAFDFGPSNTDNITNVTAMDLSGATREADTQITLTSNQAGSFTTVPFGSGAWTSSGSGLTANVTHNIRSRATDRAGNQSAQSSPLSVIIDTVAPQVSLRDPVAGSAVASLSSISVTFNESVAGVVAGDLEVDSVAATGLSGSAAGPYAFTGFGSPADNPALPIVLGAGAITDTAGNPFAGDNWTYIKNAAFPSITWTATGVTNGGISRGVPVVQLTANFSEAVTGFTQSDIDTSAGVATGINTFTVLNASTYRFNVVPSAQGIVRINVPGAVCQGVAAPAGRDNLAAPEFNYTFDSVAPTVPTFNPVTSSPTNASTIEYTAQFSENVINFGDPGDVTFVPDGTLAVASINIIPNSASNYTIEFVGVTGEGVFTPRIPAGVCTDAAGNNNAQRFGGPVVVDSTPPVLTIDVLATQNNSPALTGTVSDANIDVTVIVDGQSNLANVNGNDWELPAGTLLPLADGIYDVQALATDSVGNAGADTTLDELKIDANPPNLQLIGLPFITVDCGQGFDELIDGGYTAIDAVDGDITGLVDVSLTIPPTTPPGVYDIDYDITDSAGNSASVTRTIEVLANCPLSVGAGQTFFEREGGESVVMEIIVGGAVGSYGVQWYRDRGSKAPELVTDTDGNDDTLTLNNLGQFDEAQYFAVVTDAVTEVTSPIFTLLVNVDLPLAGLAGMSLLTALTAAAGAMTLRRRK